MFNRIAVAVALLALTGAPLQAGSCSCTKADGSCSASANCPDGCFAVCGSSGCTADCVDNRDVLGPVGGEPTISLSAKAISAGDLQALVAEQMGTAFFFVPKDSSAPLNVEFQQVTPLAALRALSRFGVVAVADQPDNKAKGQRFSIQALNVEAAVVARLLHDLSGGQLKALPSDPREKVSIDLKQVSLRDVQRVLPKVTGIAVELAAR